MTRKPKKKTYYNNHPDIEGVTTPDGYKSQTLDKILPKKHLETGPAARLMAPPDYEFSPDNSSLQIITARIGGNDVVSQVIQIDDKYSRVLWSRGSTINGDMTELQKALDWQLERIKPEINDDGSANSITRIGIFFSILGVLIDKGVFPKRLTVDTFIESGISLLYGNENIHKWIADWFQFIRQDIEGVRDKIVLMDTTTSENISKWYSVRGVYHNIEKMRWSDEIIESEEKALGRKLTGEEKIEALTRAGEYLAPAPDGSGDILAYSDRWGEFVISVTLPIFADDQNQNRREQLEKRLKEPELFDNAQVIKQLNEELSRIILYQNAAKIYRMSAAYYFYYRTKRITIPKSEALEFFGRDPEDKAAYSEIKSAAWAVYNANIIIRGSKVRGKRRFWSEFTEDHKNFYIGFLPELWPATRELVESYGKERTPEAAEILRIRRYHEYPPRIEAAGLSAYGDFYAGFLLRETGNKKIKDIPEGQKVIARTGADHCTEARIQDSNPNRRKKSMISTWRDIMNKTNLITRIEPSIKTLEALTPGRFSKTQIHVYATSDAAKINEYLKERQSRRT